MTILESMLIALVLTLILELFFAALWGIRNRRDILIVILANVMTNPLVNFLHAVFADLIILKGWAMTAATAALEISAVIAEWYVYKKGTEIKKPFLFSLGANAFSFLCGLLINFLG